MRPEADYLFMRNELKPVFVTQLASSTKREILKAANSFDELVKHSGTL